MTGLERVVAEAADIESMFAVPDDARLASLARWLGVDVADLKGDMARARYLLPRDCIGLDPLDSIFVKGEEADRNKDRFVEAMRARPVTPIEYCGGWFFVTLHDLTTELGHVANVFRLAPAIPLWAVKECRS